MQICKILLVKPLLRLLFNWPVVQNDVLYLFMIEFFVCFTNHSVKFFGIKVIPDQVFKFIGWLRSKLLKQLFSFTIRVRILKCLFQSNIFLDFVIMLSHYVIHLLNVLIIILFGSVNHRHSRIHIEITYYSWCLSNSFSKFVLFYWLI